MEISLKPVTKGNWLEALELQVGEEQKRFVPTVAVSLAKVYIKPDGDGVEYHWINGFLIDSKHQGKGYGKSALR